MKPRRRRDGHILFNAAPVRRHRRRRRQPPSFQRRNVCQIERRDFLSIEIRFQSLRVSFFSVLDRVERERERTPKEKKKWNEVGNELGAAALPLSSFHCSSSADGIDVERLFQRKPKWSIAALPLSSCHCAGVQLENLELDWNEIASRRRHRR